MLFHLTTDLINRPCDQIILVAYEKYKLLKIPDSILHKEVPTIDMVN